jgi:hypothetical protein
MRTLLQFHIRKHSRLSETILLILLFGFYCGACGDSGTTVSLPTGEVAPAEEEAPVEEAEPEEEDSAEESEVAEPAATIEQPVTAKNGALIEFVPHPLMLSEGETKQVEIWLRNIEDLWGAEVILNYSPAKAEVIDAIGDEEGIQIVPGDFPLPEFIALNRVDSEAGEIVYAAVQMSPSEPSSGDGLLAVVPLAGLGEGDPELTLELIKLSTPNGQQIQVEMIDQQ